MWFGHGIKPRDEPGPATRDAVPPLAQRINAVGRTLVAGLPQSKRYHAIARLGGADHERLDRILTAVAAAVPLGPQLTALRVLGMQPDWTGVAPFVKAGALLAGAASFAELREATDLVARSALEMGMDRFLPFLREADAHLTATGGMLALLRDVPAARAPAVAAPAVRGAGAALGGAALSAVLRAAGWAGLVAFVVGLVGDANRKALLAAAFTRFGLDPSKAADVAAALAYVWAQLNRSLLQGTGLPEWTQDAVAARIMRAVQADPGLLERALKGEAAALETIRAVVRGMAVPGVLYEARDDEERALVAQLLAEGKDGNAIETALPYHRMRRGAPPTPALRCGRWRRRSCGLASGRQGRMGY